MTLLTRLGADSPFQRRGRVSPARKRWVPIIPTHKRRGRDAFFRLTALAGHRK